MRISVKALFKAAGIKCVQKITNSETGAEQMMDARLAFVTEGTVSAARRLGKSDEAYEVTDGDPEVTYGSAVAVSRGSAGTSKGQVITPGSSGSFFISIDGAFEELTGSNMLRLREKMIQMTRNGETLNTGQRHALVGIQEIFEMVSSAPDTSRFPSDLISQSYHASITDAFGDVEIPITPDQFASKSRADLYRARIGILDSSHPDGMNSARSLRDILSSGGIEVSESGVGAEIRGSSANMINEEAIRRTILGNDRMCREVFGALTGTPIEKLSAAMIPLSSLKKLRELKSNKRLSGDWIVRAAEVAQSITQGGMSGYQFELDIFSEGGRDILTISDSIGQKNDVAFVYSWPTSERIPVMEINSGRVMNVSPEEVPDNAELDRLSKVLGQLEAVNIHNPDSHASQNRFDH